MPAAFRLYSKLDTFFSLAGTLLPDGYIKFYSAGSTTPKNVFNELALTTNLGSQVSLDAGAGLVSDVWGSGSYFIELYDAANVKQGEADNVQIPGGEATALPALLTGKYLTNDGAVMSWGTIRQVPDMTGHAGKKLGTDGTTAIWETTTIPTLPTGGVSNVTGGFRIGTIMVLTGTVTMPITGTHTATSAVVFPTAFNATPSYVGLTNMTGPISPSGAQGTLAAQGASSTGFTISHDVNIDSTDPGWNISIAASVKWVAIGPVT